jgi:hypothetical protein
MTYVVSLSLKLHKVVNINYNLYIQKKNIDINNIFKNVDTMLFFLTYLKINIITLIITTFDTFDICLILR